jgi:DNA-binding NtrC family response regulator
LPQVLVVDDEAAMRTALVCSFERRGRRVDTANGMEEAMAKFRAHQHRLVVTDIRMPGGDGFSLMRALRQREPDTAVIFLTGFGCVPDAVHAMKDGACDYLMKPVAFDQLEKSAQRVLGELETKKVMPHSPAGGPISSEANDSHSANDLIGHSPLLLRALARGRQVAPSNADILIEAESGTGKELLARMIHRLSPRHSRPMVAVNCAAFPETLLESELFGYVKGAFTGALASRAGKFELAHGGTLLLDEVGEMPLALQPKLLRALQEREFDRLGDSRSVKVDIRVIATTNRSLATMVKAGSFRTDLYYRLNVIPLSLPPLRERREDVRELAEHFAAVYSIPSCVPQLDTEFLRRLESHDWPGNVRELANLLRRAVALSGEIIGTDVLDESELNSVASNVHLPSLAVTSAGELVQAGASLDSVERRLIQMTLNATQGNRSRAAEMLGVSLRTVRNKIRQYGLPPRREYVHVHD